MSTVSEPEPLVVPQERRRWAVVLGSALVIAGVGWWGRSLSDAGEPVYLGAPPFYGSWREGGFAGGRPGLWWPAVLVVLGLTVLVPGWWVRAVARLRWAWVLLGSWCWAVIWSAALAASDGSSRLSEPLLDARFEYLPWARGIDSPAAFVSGFLEHLSAMPTHVRGHPPGAVLAFWGLDRVFTTDTSITAALVILAGTAAPAALLAVRAVADDAAARRAAPFVGLAPAALWIATSPDALFAAVLSWAVALGAMAWAARGRGAIALGGAAGLLAGAALTLSYGYVAMLAPLAAVCALLAAHRRFAEIAAVATGSVVAPLLLAVAGFDWIDGIAAVREQYLAGVGGERPTGYFLVANLAVLAVAIGPAALGGLATLRDRRLWWLVGGALAGVLLADLSGMSKGEVERIWLPAVPWIVIASSSIRTSRSRTLWAAVTMVSTILLQWQLDSPW